MTTSKPKILVVLTSADKVPKTGKQIGWYLVSAVPSQLSLAYPQIVLCMLQISGANIPSLSLLTHFTSSTLLQNWSTRLQKAASLHLILYLLSSSKMILFARTSSRTTSQFGRTLSSSATLLAEPRSLTPFSTPVAMVRW